MLNIKASFANHDSNIFFTTYFQGKSNYIVLATHSTMKSELYDNANSLLINEVLLQDWENSSKDKIENQIKEFFVELNWKLYAQFRQTNLPEQGISVILAVVFDNDVYLAQFGRMLCCTVTGKKRTELGRTWDNFHVKTKNELFLLGSIEDNIHVKVMQISLKPGTYLITIPSTLSDRFTIEFDSAFQPLAILSKFYEESAFPYFIIGADIKRSEKKKSFFLRRKFRISAIIAIILIILTLLYMRQGNNCVQEYINRARLLFKHQTRIQFTDVLNHANPTFEKQIRQLEKVALSPARSISLRTEMIGEMSYPITAVPQWDIENIYLISHNNLIALDKKTHLQKWNKHFENELLNMKKTDDKSLLVLEKNSQAMLIHNDGKEIWNNPSIQYKQPLESPSKSTTPYEITFQDDARLNANILVFQAVDMIYLVNSLSGDTISQYRFSEPISYISSYDPLEHCFYVIIDRTLIKLYLDIRSW
ncbi:MAG TPA: hypothetical protein PLE74_08415 [Candidatus Cloacimonadota bacterium]|nr:hypothetical protein [Candidatus Cloacimonadota bacterium]